MKMKPLNEWDWTGIGIMFLFSVMLSAIGIDMVDKPLSWCLLNVLFVWGTSHSYRMGMDKGYEIMKELWDRR